MELIFVYLFELFIDFWNIIEYNGIKRKSMTLSIFGCSWTDDSFLVASLQNSEEYLTMIFVSLIHWFILCEFFFVIGKFYVFFQSVVWKEKGDIVVLGNIDDF